MKEKIPQQFEELADSITYKKDQVSFSLRCSCGNSVFKVYKNKETKTEEQLKIEQDYIDFVKRCWIRSYYISLPDEHGVRRAYRKNIFGKIVDSVVFPMWFDDTVIKISCCECNKESIIFHSRFHGYDGLAIEKKGEEKSYTWKPFFAKKEKLCRLFVVLKNDMSYEEFVENFGEETDLATYYNAFSWINITGLVQDDTKKKVTILDLETR